MKNKLSAFLTLASLATLHQPLSTLHAQTTAFTYQGRLNDGGNPATGIYDLRFTIYDSTNLASPVIAGPLTNTATAVSNGLFTVALDFGAGSFPGADRFLEIAVRTNGSGAFATLSPRQKITSAPYAIQAANATSVSGSVSATQLTGTIAPANIGAGTISSTMLATGSVTSVQLADGAVTAPKVATVSNWFALTIPNPTPENLDSFGWSVAAVGSDRVLIGAPNDDTGATDAGAAYLFSTNGTLLVTFNNPTPTGGDNFAWSVAALGSDRVLIGAPYNSTGAP